MTWYVRADDHSCRVLGKLDVETQSPGTALQMARSRYGKHVYISTNGAPHKPGKAILLAETSGK